LNIPHRLSWSVAACVALAFGAPALAQELGTSQELQLVGGTATVQKPTASAVSTYIVRLREAPAVAYDGNIPGLKATRPGQGKKIDPESPAVIDYATYLQARHDAVLAQQGGGSKLHSYVYTFNGFAAKLSAGQAKKLESNPAVVSVWKDEELHLSTNRTPTFLGLTATGGLWSQLGGVGKAGEDIIIGMVDSGFWPESASFSDRDAEGKLAYQNIPHWPGKCHPGEAFNASNCNQKVIGARYYNTGFGGDAAVKARYPNDFNSPRDGASHGSHTASTAGGNSGVHALVNDIDLGVISGMAPRARLSVYKTCYGDGLTSACFTSDSVAAIDQAVADGVDVLNYSISGSLTSNVDAVQVAFLFAVDAGVFVAAAAGNEGSTASTVNHNAPWMTTVAAGTHDRIYASGVTLGNNASYFGVSVHGGTLSQPTVLSQDAGVASVAGLTAAQLAVQVAQCWSNNTGGGLNPPTGADGNRLDPAKVAGKIVVCDRGGNARVDKSDAVKAAGGIGMILTNVTPGTLDPDPHVVPTVHVQSTDRAAIYTYVSATTGPTSALAPGIVSGGVVAPDVAAFSSRGPARASGGDILKPDVMAPGVSVLAAVSPVTPTEGGKNFDFFQGTSMATPHIAGIAALFKQRHPDWSPAMIKSALMTSASQLRNNGTAIAGGPFAIGAGQVNPNGAVDPGLVYDASFNDWLNFLCGTGEVTGCGAATIDPSNLNYPSIAIGALPGTQTVKRTVKNVGSSTSTYTAAVSGSTGLSVSVSDMPMTIAPGQSKSYNVTFTRTTAALNAYATGAISLSDGTHTVRSPFAVKPVVLQNPAEVSSTGGAISYPVTFGYTGPFGALARGLVAPLVTAGSVVDDPTDQFTGVPGQVGTTAIPVTIPAGTSLIRFALFNTDVDGPHDLDLYVYQGTSLVGSSGGTSSDEAVTLTFGGGVNASPIPLTVIVHGYNTATPVANFKLFQFYVGTAAAGNMAVTTPATAVQATTGTVNVTFGALAPHSHYLGSVAHHNGVSFLPSPTIVSVNTP
jgi:subtilisin family serine protease